MLVFASVFDGRDAITDFSDIAGSVAEFGLNASCP